MRKKRELWPLLSVVVSCWFSQLSHLMHAACWKTFAEFLKEHMSLNAQGVFPRYEIPVIEIIRNKNSERKQKWHYIKRGMNDNNDFYWRKSTFLGLKERLGVLRFTMVDNSVSLFIAWQSRPTLLMLLERETLHSLHCKRRGFVWFFGWFCCCSCSSSFLVSHTFNPFLCSLIGLLM